MSVILINAFEIAEEDEEACLAYWRAARDVMARQPGYIATRLHRALGPARFRFVNVAEFESAEHFRAATETAEFRAAVGPGMDRFPHFPGLFEVVFQDAG